MHACMHYKTALAGSGLAGWSEGRASWAARDEEFMWVHRKLGELWFGLRVSGGSGSYSGVQ